MRNLLHRARVDGDDLSYLFLDTHFVQLIWIDIRDEQVRAGKSNEQDYKDRNNDRKHDPLLSGDYYNNFQT